MGHHIGDEAVSKTWTRICNDLIHRVVQLFPENFIGVCQLPQSPGVPVSHSIEELDRCINELASWAATSTRILPAATGPGRR